MVEKPEVGTTYWYVCDYTGGFLEPHPLVVLRSDNSASPSTVPVIDRDGAMRWQVRPDQLFSAARPALVAAVAECERGIAEVRSDMVVRAARFQNRHTEVDWSDPVVPRRAEMRRRRVRINREHHDG